MENILNSNFFYSPDMLFNSYYDSSYSGSDLLNDYDILNETQIGNVRRIDVSVNEDINSEYEEEENRLELNQRMEFETWEFAELYLNEYAKQQEFSFCKKNVYWIQLTVQ
ncbi:unnamed protein product [Rhizophagus irregularis]|nr:unnamed protein product [Rhizophagus irregularis]